MNKNHPNPTSTDQAERLRRLVANRPTRRTSPRRGVSIAITSGKGGVGKTNIAVNLAVSLAATGRQVTLVDLDVGLANADVLLDAHPRYNLSHVLNGERGIAQVAEPAAGGISFVAGGSGVDALVNLNPFERRRLAFQVKTINQTADVVIYDCGAGISANVLTFAVIADLVMVVSTPEPTALTDAYAMIKMLARETFHPPVQLLVNMAGGRAEAREVYRRVSTACQKFLQFALADGGYVLQDSHVEAAVRGRCPFVLCYPRCPSSLCVTALAVRLVRAGSSAPQQGGLLSRFVGLFA